MIEEDSSWVRVNRDDLRNMRGNYWIPSQEKLISEWEYHNIEAALMAGYNVISDSTNLNLSTVARLTNIAMDCDAEIEFVSIEVDVEEAIRRDATRPNPVGENVIRSFHAKYIDKFNKK